MSAPQTPSDPDPHAERTSDQGQPPDPQKRPWGWIALAGFLAIAVIGLVIYASGINSDLDDANAKTASQQKQIASQQKEIEEAQDTGAAAVKAAYDDLSSKLGAAQEDAGQAVEQASAKLTKAEQDAADASGTAEELQKQADAAKAKADTAATCAESFLSAFGGVFSGSSLKEGIEATVKELQALQPKCASALDQG